MKAKWNIWLALVAVFALVAAACGDDDSASTSGPIRIGVLSPTTSFLATLGLDGNEAIEYYFNTEVGGEIAGRPIELIFEDTAADPVLALTKAQKTDRAGQRRHHPRATRYSGGSRSSGLHPRPRSAMGAERRRWLGTGRPDPTW